MTADAARAPDDEAAVSAVPLGTGEIRGRAVAGAALLGARSAVVYAFGLVANLALARLLAPRDFGLIALGTVLVVFGTYLAEGGLGAALIRREQAPERSELGAVLGLQLAVLTGVTLAVAAAGAAVGRDGLVVATMVASLPIATLRTPAVIVLERQLRYGPIATADVVQAVTYYVWAIVAVALGFGVWGMATAVVARAVVGTATVFALGPTGLVKPRWSWSTVRPVIGFGARFQATSALMMLREQSLNVLVAAIAGLATLGVWNLAWRVLQIPNLVFQNVGRVAFPAMSRLIGAGQDPKPVLERAVSALAVLTGVATAGIVGLAPALPAIVGREWADVPEVILWSGVALTLTAPLAVGAVGYLLAAGDAGPVAVATLVSAAVWLAIAAALLPSHGAPAVGLGWVAAGGIYALMLARRAVARSGARLGRRASPAAAVALAAIAVGWTASNELADGLAAGAIGALAAEGVLLVGLAVVSRPGLRDTRALLAQALASLRPGGDGPGRRRRAERT